MLTKIKSAPPPGAEPDEFVMSDASVDRMGDVIEQDGWLLDNFKKHPVALWNHNRDAVIGRWVDVGVRNGRLTGRLQFAEAGTSPLIDTLRSLHRQKFLRAVSVGFRALEHKPLSEKSAGQRFLKHELLECSLVSIPANASALAIAKDLPRAVFDQIFGKPASGDLEPTGAFHRKPANVLVTQKGATMNISQSIENTQRRLNNLRDQQAIILADDEKDEATRTQEAADLSDQIDAAAHGLENLRKIERSQALSIVGPRVSAREQITAPAIMHKNLVRPIERDGDYVIRKATIQLVSYLSKRHPDEVLRDFYGNDEKTGIVLRAASNPAMTTVAGWAAELVQTANADYVDTKKSNRIFPEIASRGLRLTFGRNGIIKIPARAATPTLAGDWVGEGNPIPVKQMGLTSVSLTPKKLGVISVVTREIMAHSTPMIETLVKDAMGNDTSLIIDTLLVSNAVATAIKPAGLLAGVAALTPSASTTPAIAMVDDISALVNAITAVNGGENLVILVHPAQAFRLGAVMAPNGTFMFSSINDAGQRFGVTFVASTTVPVKTVICVDAADFASVTGDVPEYDVSEQATLHMEDTTPLPIATGAQGSGVLATPTRSLFQTASIGIRFLLDMNWTMRRTGMVSWTQNVLW